MAHGPPASAKRKNTPNGDVEIENETNLLPLPPDGGWGWMVVFASFMIHIITDGMTYSFGMFYVEFLDYFKEGKGYTAWICSLLVGVTLCSGPISSAFVNRYGCRAVTIFGAIFAASCILISELAQNVLTLIITIGFGTGLGFGLIYLPAIVSVTQYFEKRRSLATGIAVCGSGFGTFVFAPLTETLINNFGWRGAMLVISAIVLNCIIFGIMFRPLEPPTPVLASCKNSKTPNHLKHSTDTELQPLKSKENGVQIIDSSPESPEKTTTTTTTVVSRSHSIGHDIILNSIKKHNNISMGHANGVTHTQKDKLNDIIRATVSQPHINTVGTRMFKESKTISGSGTMYRPDIFYQWSVEHLNPERTRNRTITKRKYYYNSSETGSLLNIPEYRSRTDLSMRNPTNYGSVQHERSLHTIEEEPKLCGCVPCSRETHDTFTEMMNFSLLKDGIFIIFTFSNFCTSIGFNVPYVYIAAQAAQLNLSKEQASHLLGIIGIANTVGRVVLGYFSDKTWVNRLLVYNACLTLCGVATALSVFCTDFTSLATYASVFGFTIGAYVGLTSVILVDLLGLDKLTNAFGLLLLFQGIASLVGPPFAGWLYDLTKSYNPGFLMAGVTITISGLVLFAIPTIQRYRAKNEEEIRNRERMVSIS